MLCLFEFLTADLFGPPLGDEVDILVDVELLRRPVFLVGDAFGGDHPAKGAETKDQSPEGDEVGTDVAGMLDDMDDAESGDRHAGEKQEDKEDFQEIATLYHLASIIGWLTLSFKAISPSCMGLHLLA